jgi:hypothetical protein
MVSLCWWRVWNTRECKDCAQNILEYINSIHPDIKFITEHENAHVEFQ